MKIKNGKFVIDNKELFLFSAEIHYFRIPFNDWEDRLKKIKAAGF
ncbi:MAG: beta-galactosidase, partial [Fervidobacterium sp.]